MKRDEAVARGARVFKTWYVDSVKDNGTAKEREKSRLVLCGYNDAEAKELLTKAPTVSKTSVRIFLAISASSPGHVRR